MMTISEQSRGFTLLEVMVALTVASLSLFAVMASISQMVDTSTTIRDRTYASWIAQNKLAELRLQNESPEVGESSGEVDFSNLEWRWEATISETAVESLHRIDVDIFFAGRDEAIWRSTGFVGEPGIPGEANRAWLVGGQAPGVTQ